MPQHLCYYWSIELSVILNIPLLYINFYTIFWIWNRNIKGQWFLTKIIFQSVTAAPKIELSRAEKFQQDQTDSGQELVLDSLEQVKLDYDREDDPVILEEGEPTELYNYISEVAR